MGAVEAKNRSENVSRVLYPDDSTEPARSCACARSTSSSARRCRTSCIATCASTRGFDAPGGQGGDPPERHAPGAGHRRADAPAGRRAPPAVGRGLGPVHAHLLVHQPHADARGAGDLAGRHDRPAAAAPPARSSSRSTRASSPSVHAQVPGRPRPARARVADRRERARAASAWPTSPCSPATRSTACRALHSELIAQDHLRRLRAHLPRPLQQQDQRHHAAALARPGQPALAALIDQPHRHRLAPAPGRARAAAPAGRRRRVPRARSAASSSRTSCGWRHSSSATARRQARPASLFDVQVKRIHEYKRQLLNVLHVITRYHRILADPQVDWVPRTRDLRRQGGLGLPHGQADHQADQRRRRSVVNADPRRRRPAEGRLPAELPRVAGRDHHPGADLSEQISTAGTEASGTGNMKLALNGALTIGTWTAPTSRSPSRSALDNIFIFGNRRPSRSRRCAPAATTPALLPRATPT